MLQKIKNLKVNNTHNEQLKWIIFAVHTLHNVIIKGVLGTWIENKLYNNETLLKHMDQLYQTQHFQEMSIQHSYYC